MEEKSTERKMTEQEMDELLAEMVANKKASLELQETIRKTYSLIFENSTEIKTLQAQIDQINNPQEQIDRTKVKRRTQAPLGTITKRKEKLQSNLPALYDKYLVDSQAIQSRNTTLNNLSSEEKERLLSYAPLSIARLLINKQIDKAAEIQGVYSDMVKSMNSDFIERKQKHLNGTSAQKKLQ